MINTKFLLMVFAILFLTACGTPVPQIVYKTKTVLVTPPEELIVKCSADAPPDKDTYINSTTKEKEKLLIDHSTNQMTNLRKCAGTVESIRDWVHQQMAVFKSADETTDKPKP